MTEFDLIPPMMSLNTWRNRLAHRLAKWALNHIADEHYRTFIYAAIRVGLTFATDGGQGA